MEIIDFEHVLSGRAELSKTGDKTPWISLQPDDQDDFMEMFLHSQSVMLPICFSKWRDAILFLLYFTTTSLQWRHNGRNGVLNHQPHGFYSTVYSGADQRKHQSSVSPAFVWGIRRSPVNSPQKMASNAVNVSIWWRHHDRGLNKLGIIAPAKFWIEFSWMKIVVFHFQRSLFLGANW